MWRNGDLNRNNSSYVEDDSVPYRYVISGLNPGVHTVHLNYAFTKNGVFAFDYLTTYNATEHPDVCDGFSPLLCGPSVTPATASIPIDPDPSVVNQKTGQVVTLYGAVSGSFGSYTLTGDITHNSTKDIVLTFTTDASHPDVLITWAGHLASSFDHGYGMGAGSIGGAPFHMSSQNLDCAGTHSQDRSIQPSVVSEYPYGAITVDKVTEPTGDEQVFEFTLTQDGEVVGTTQLQDATEPYTFVRLQPGTYSLAEVQMDGWDLKDAVCTKGETVVDPEAIILTRLDHVTCVFTNTKMTGTEPELQITKENDATTDKHIGDIVTYAITVKALKDAVMNTHVLDLPPGGFVYESGSWTASSSVRGDIKNSVTTEPTYHSPGTWILGDMVPEEVVTLTYKAKITDKVEPGLYRDVAWADGVSQSETRVLAAAQPLGYVAPVFVGTHVNIVKDEQQTTSVNVEKKEERQEKSEGSVLGASTTSTTLPATGAQPLWLVLSSILAAAGLLSMIGGMRLMHKAAAPTKKKRLRKAIIAGAACLVGFLFFPTSVHAVEPLSIRIETPKSPTYRNDFYLNFVTLDIDGREVSVSCFKKGPGEATFTQFGSSMTVSTGGNTNYCTVNNSIISQNGTYEFYATATVPDAVSSSQVVSVDYNTSGPGTPTNYSKDRIGCGYTIHARTADDGGKTVKVEIYRSESTSFDLNGSTRVQVISAGSNTDITYNNTVPDCSKTYYYAVRAFDAAGNGSGVIGDTVITTTTTTTTTTSTTATAQSSGPIVVSESSVPPVEAESQGQIAGTQTDETKTEILGEATPSSETVSNPITGSPEAAQSVLGVAVDKRTKYAGIGIVILCISAAAYVIFRKTKTKKEQTA